MSNEKKRLQVILSDEAWAAVEQVTKQANDNFETGTINYSDVINEMIVCSKVDVKALQQKHTSIRRSLKVLASKTDIDLDTAIKALTELKARQTGKRKSVNQSEEA